MASSKAVSRLSSRSSQSLGHNLIKTWTDSSKFSSLKSRFHSEACTTVRPVAPPSRLPVELSSIRSMMPLQSSAALARWISFCSDSRELVPQDEQLEMQAMFEIFFCSPLILCCLDSLAGPLVSRSSSANPPRHFSMKVESFSLLQKTMDRYESKEFEAGGYKWKLVLFPNGNRARNGKDHISLYLEMAGLEAIKATLHVLVDFKFFLLNQYKKNYLVLEEEKKKERYCFYRTIVGGMAGFDQLISLKDFTNGYLYDDTCEFGVEVFVSEEKRRDRLGLVSMFDNGVMYKHVWKIPHFSKLDGPCHSSEPFPAGDQKYCAWKLMLYPKGTSTSSDYLSLFLVLDNPAVLPPGSEVFAEFTLRILDLNCGKHHSLKSEQWFSASSWSWGWDEFLTQKAKFFKKDQCIVEAEITIKGISS